MTGKKLIGVGRLMEKNTDRTLENFYAQEFSHEPQILHFEFLSQGTLEGGDVRWVRTSNKEIVHVQNKV